MIGEAPTAFKTLQRKAAKDHKCCECRDTILKGTMYQYSSGVWDGVPDSYKQCINCHEIMSAVASNSEYDEMPCFEHLREHILEDSYKPAEAFLEETSKHLSIEPERLNSLLRLTLSDPSA